MSQAELPHSIYELSQLFRMGALSPVEVTQECLRRISQLDPALNAFITVMTDSAMAQARQAEAEIGRGEWRGPLHGIPIGLKDLIDTAGVRTTAASALFRDRIPEEDAEVVRRLKAAGAVLIGKQNLHEFAYGGSSVVSNYGAVHNPWAPAYIVGGSSGGSAAAVAAGLGYGAIGTDTAGSVREPAGLCGVVGLKPTYGRISARGVIPLSPRLDHVGPIARTVADAAVLLQAIAGYDSDDTNSVDVPVEDYSARLYASVKQVRLGVPRELFYEDLSPEVSSAVENALSVLSAVTAGVSEIQLRAPTDRRLQSAESYAYHAEWARTSPELYQPETLRRILSGKDVGEADYAEQRRALARARSEIAAVFDTVDVLLTPTTPIPAPAVAELTENPALLRPRELLLLRNTRPFNVWGLPAISVPCGFTESGLPIGLQIAGPHWGEAQVLRVAHAFEQATDWHTWRPPICD